MIKKSLFASAALATLFNANAECNSISLKGLHLGVGFVTNFDEYEAEVDTVDALYKLGGSVEKWETNADVANNLDAPVTSAEAKTIMDAMMAFKENGNITPALSISRTPPVEIIPDNTQINVTNTGAYSAYLLRNHKLKRRSTNCGGEIKIAYFHDFGNHLMIGVDFGCTFNSKAKKKINIAKAENTGTVSYKLENPEDTSIATMTADGNVTVGNNAALANNAHAFVKAQSTDTTSNTQAAFNTALTSKNGGSILGGANGEINAQTTAEADKYLHAGDATELSFEKDIFSPRLAFVIGGTVYGWFAGVRTGVSYMTGKIRGTDGTRSINKSVSISSPFIGIQVMKQMPILNNNAHVYLTADWNMGDGHRAVNINGVKSYKQNNVNIALGVTWRCKFGA